MNYRPASLCIILVSLIGCNQKSSAPETPTPASSKPAEPDPVEKLNELITSGKKTLEPDKRYQLVSTDHDVQKSNSVISPFEGIIKLHVRRLADDEVPSCDYKVTLNYVFRDGRWVFRSGAYSKRLASGRGYDDAVLRGPNFIEIRGIVEPFEARDMNG